MPGYELTTPQLRFIAQPLHEFANQHGITTTDADIAHAQQYTSETNRRHGHAIADSVDRLVRMGLGRKFEVPVDVPQTIPLFLGRLALYERGHLGSSEGVWMDEVRWLRLFNIPMSDPRIDDIIGIIGAHRSPDDEVYLSTDDDVLGRPTPYTIHPIAGDNYAIRISQTEPHTVHLPVTLIDFSLPDKKYVPKNERHTEENDD